MKHLFVPYKIALELKEKGFNEPCFLSYEEDQELCERSIRSYNHYYTEDEDKFHCSAPLYQQVIDWFEQGEIYIYTFYSCGRWQWKRDVGNSYDDFSRGDGFKTKYEALTKAIEEALKLI